MAVAPHWFWRRKFGIFQCAAESDPELQLVRSLCDPARVSIDIGAAGGRFTVAMLQSSRSVIAFEPLPSEARALAAMFDVVGAPVRVEAVALSDKLGLAEMRMLVRDSGRSTIENDNDLYDHDGSPVRNIEVSVKRLDDLQLDEVGFIKIDVEGHELGVLRGATETLRRNRPAIYIEAEERHHPNAVREVSEFLSQFGYTGYFELNGTRRHIGDFNATVHQNPSNIASWRENWAKRGVYVNNFVFLPQSSASSL